MKPTYLVVTTTMCIHPYWTLADAIACADDAPKYGQEARVFKLVITDGEWTKDVVYDTLRGGAQRHLFDVLCEKGDN